MLSNNNQENNSPNLTSVDVIIMAIENLNRDVPRRPPIEIQQRFRNMHNNINELALNIPSNSEQLEIIDTLHQYLRVLVNGRCIRTAYILIAYAQHLLRIANDARIVSVVDTNTVDSNTPVAIIAEIAPNAINNSNGNIALSASNMNFLIAHTAAMLAVASHLLGNDDTMSAAIIADLASSNNDAIIPTNEHNHPNSRTDNYCTIS
jgi:hypothetical protein